MEDRRLFLSLLASAAAPLLQAEPQQPSAIPKPVNTAGRIPLPPPFDKQSATFVELHIEPGKHALPHKHPGFVLGYVIEGEFRFQIAGEPVKVLRAGDIFYEPPGATHTVSESANPAKPARVLAIIIADTARTNLSEPA